MSECVPDGGQFLVAEPGALGVPDGDLESSEATGPVVVQCVQRGRGAAAGDHHGERCEAVVALVFEQVAPPLGGERRAAVGTTELLAILTTVDNGECVVPGDVDLDVGAAGEPGGQVLHDRRSTVSRGL